MYFFNFLCNCDVFSAGNPEPCILNLINRFKRVRGRYFQTHANVYFVVLPWVKSVVLSLCSRSSSFHFDAIPFSLSSSVELFLFRDRPPSRRRIAKVRNAEAPQKEEERNKSAGMDEYGVHRNETTGERKRTYERCRICNRIYLGSSFPVNFN